MFTLTLPATISVTAAVIGLFFALLALGLSYGPGWRELRWFALGSVLAACFVLSNFFVTLPAPARVIAVGGRLAPIFAGLHGASWFFYVAARERRRLSSLEKLIVAIGIAGAASFAIPGLSVLDGIVERSVPSLGLVYRDVETTPVGAFFYAYDSASMLFLVAHFGVRWRRGEQGAFAHMAGLLAIVVTAISDVLASAGLTAMPYVIDFGFIAMLVAVGGSITTRFVASARSLELASRTLRATQAQLVERERLAALGSLSAVIAHEVRNSIGVVFNAVAMLRKLSTQSDDSSTLFKIVEEEAHRLKRMVADLLNFARPYDLRLAPAQLDELIRGAVSASRMAAHEDETAVKVELVLASQEIWCDEQLVRQAIVNLVSNALQAPRKQAPVSVRVETQAATSDLRISVRDDGEGVSPDQREKLFTPFFTTRPTGTGLGLALVRRIAEAHGGSVAFQPTPGGGATFVMTLPLQPPSVDHAVSATPT